MKDMRIFFFFGPTINMHIHVDALESHFYQNCIYKLFDQLCHKKQHSGFLSLTRPNTNYTVLNPLTKNSAFISLPTCPTFLDRVGRGQTEIIFNVALEIFCHCKAHFVLDLEFEHNHWSHTCSNRAIML